jgi:ABC-type dipeptide/oligopeptide/nickel transport systems, permease components
MKKRLLSLIVLSLIVLISLIASLVLPASYDSVNTSERNLPFSFAHPLGTDSLGRDMLLRLSEGTLTSLLIAFSSSALSLLLALVFGMFSAFHERAEIVLMRLLDGIRAIPGFALALFFMAISSRSFLSLVFILTVISLPRAAYLIKNAALSVLSEEFVLAKRSLGSGRFHLAFNTVLPHIMPTLLSQFAFSFVSSILMESSLSYLGVGISPPSASLGALLMEGRASVLSHPAETLIPALMLFAITLSVRAFIRSFEKYS